MILIYKQKRYRIERKENIPLLISIKKTFILFWRLIKLGIFIIVALVPYSTILYFALSYLNPIYYPHISVLLVGLGVILWWIKMGVIRSLSVNFVFTSCLFSVFTNVANDDNIAHIVLSSFNNFVSGFLYYEQGIFLCFIIVFGLIVNLFHISGYVFYYLKKLLRR